MTAKELRAIARQFLAAHLEEKNIDIIGRNRSQAEVAIQVLNLPVHLNLEDE